MSVAVDQSGPMLDEAMFATIMASIFYELPSAQTIVMLITEFDEGASEYDSVNKIADMAQAGMCMIAWGALVYNARSDYNKATAQKCRKPGEGIRVCIPE